MERVRIGVQIRSYVAIGTSSSQRGKKGGGRVDGYNF